MITVKRKYQIKNNSDGYKYIEIGYIDHGKTKRIWINRNIELINANKYIEFPLKNAKLELTSKGNLVIRPQIDTYIFDIFVKCGYRGSSNITILSSIDYMFEYQEFHSPRGSLGISSGVLVCTTIPYVEFEFERSGRLYGAPDKGKLCFNIDGTQKEIIDDEEVLKLIN